MKNQKYQGSLIIIGGHEDKAGKKEILKEVVKFQKNQSGALVVITVASGHPDEMAENYLEVFKQLGVKKMEVLDIKTREDAFKADNVAKLEGASLLFFTGGDQLRITSQVGDSPTFQSIRKFLEEGGTVVGTSAGAAAMSETMLVAGPGEESNRLTALNMAPGLGFIENVVIDSHFAQRGRIGRLLGAVSQNPANLGIGIDENTAIKTSDSGECFEVLGEGAVYVIDGSKITYSNLSDANSDKILSLHGTILHVLGAGEKYNLKSRRPVAHQKD